MEAEAFEDMQKGGGALRTVKDLSAGAAGGIAQVLIGMCTRSGMRLSFNCFVSVSLVIKYTDTSQVNLLVCCPHRLV